MFAASPCPDADAALLTALRNENAAPFVVLQRYAAAAERTGYRALKQLLALRKVEAQAARAAAVPNEPNPDPPGAAAPSAETQPTHRNGSDNGVPQTPSPAARLNPQHARNRYCQGHAAQPRFRGINRPASTTRYGAVPGHRPTPPRVNNRAHLGIALL
jgi:hypothetical protein